MRRSIARVKGLGFILWHSRHHMYHIALGLLWAWILREWWNEFNVKWVILAVLGSELPDVDHFIYFITYGRKDWYTQQLVGFLKAHQWRSIAHFLSTEHKNNTNLSYHNYYIIGLLLLFCFVAVWFDWKSSLVLVGAMITHFAMDIMDDLIILGHVNPNWKRWGRPKK